MAYSFTEKRDEDCIITYHSDGRIDIEHPITSAERAKADDRRRLERILEFMHSDDIDTAKKLYNRVPIEVEMGESLSSYESRLFRSKNKS